MSEIDSIRTHFLHQNSRILLNFAKFVGLKQTLPELPIRDEKYHQKFNPITYFKSLSVGKTLTF